MIWLCLSPRWRYYWLRRERAWYYAGIAFWVGSPSYIVWSMFRDNI